MFKICPSFALSVQERMTNCCRVRFDVVFVLSRRFTSVQYLSPSCYLRRRKSYFIYRIMRTRHLLIWQVCSPSEVKVAPDASFVCGDRLLAAESCSWCTRLRFGAVYKPTSLPSEVTLERSSKPATLLLGRSKANHQTLHATLAKLNPFGGPRPATHPPWKEPIQLKEDPVLVSHYALERASVRRAWFGMSPMTGSP